MPSIIRASRVETHFGMLMSIFQNKVSELPLGKKQSLRLNSNLSEVLFCFVLFSLEKGQVLIHKDNTHTFRKNTWKTTDIFS